LLFLSAGLRSGFAAPEGKIQQKEKQYDNRVTLMENLERSRPLNLCPKAAPLSRYDAFSATQKHVPHKKPRQYRRCLDPSMPEDDLVLRGLYKLDDQQARIYEDFARMISEFDHFDAVRSI
jgi:hypothetical protein